MALLVTHPTIAQAQQKQEDSDVPIGDSSFLMNMSYDSTNQQMTITMKEGGQYVYSSITPDVAQEFQLSKDKSSYYANFIKGRFPASRTVDKTTGPSISKKK